MGELERAIARTSLHAPEPLVLGRKIHGVVSWNMNDTCNYRCSYCTQRFLPDRSGHLTAAEVEAHVAAFRGLPGTWEIKLSGGEPFQQPGLVDIVTALVAAGHIISVQTNFSASERRLAAFLEATRGRLHVFAASLHLEYATAAEFIARYAHIRPYVDAHGVSFCVTSVATPERLVELRDAIAPAFAQAGIRFKVQPEKLHGAIRGYSEDEQATLLALGGHNGLGTLAANVQGRLCWAGSRYLVVKSTGRAFRCYPAARIGGRHAARGAIDTGFVLSDGPRACPYTHCHCTVPIERGMIQGVDPRHASTFAHLEET